MEEQHTVSPQWADSHRHIQAVLQEPASGAVQCFLGGKDGAQYPYPGCFGLLPAAVLLSSQPCTPWSQVTQIAPQFSPSNCCP